MNPNYHPTSGLIASQENGADSLTVEEMIPGTDLKVIFTVEETTPGTDLDDLLRREQTKALLQLIAAHLSRVHIVPPPSDEKTPCA